MLNVVGNSTDETFSINRYKPPSSKALEYCNDF